MTHVQNLRPRLEVVDALRGFAVMSILLLHNLEHFLFFTYPTDPPSWLAVMDCGVYHVTFSLFAGKAYAIFALLFGFTFYIQSDNQLRHGGDFGYRFLWRMILLAVFATVNAAFFPGGDVLLLFVVVSPVLFLMRNRSNRAVLLVSILFLLQPMELYHYIAHLMNPSHALPDLRVNEMYAEIAAYIASGNIRDFLVGNITLGQKASLLWAVGTGRFFQTAGLFLLGMYMGRKQLFISSPRNSIIWIRMLVVSAIAFAPLYVLKEVVMNSGTIESKTIGTALDMWQKLAFTFVLISSFMTMYQGTMPLKHPEGNTLPSGNLFSRLVSPLRIYGRMSLTNYLTQSIIGAFIYFPFGLSLAPHCGYTVSLFIGKFMFFIQICFCKWWLGRYRQGPLEHIWHKWTWL